MTQLTCAASVFHPSAASSLDCQALLFFILLEIFFSSTHADTRISESLGQLRGVRLSPPRTGGCLSQCLFATASEIWALFGPLHHSMKSESAFPEDVLGNLKDVDPASRPTSDSFQ